MTRTERQVEWHFTILKQQLKERAYSEAVIDLNYLYRRNIEAWALFKGSLDSRGFTPQQRLLVNALLNVSEAGTLDELAERFDNEIPVYLEAIKW